jgi:hypothetical protein
MVRSLRMPEAEINAEPTEKCNGEGASGEYRRCVPIR